MEKGKTKLKNTKCKTTNNCQIGKCLDKGSKKSNAIIQHISVPFHAFFSKFKIMTDGFLDGFFVNSIIIWKKVISKILKNSKTQTYHLSIKKNIWFLKISQIFSKINQL